MSLLPLRLELADQLTLRYGDTGISIHAQRVTGGWRPWDDVELHDVELRIPHGAGALRVRASGVRLEGTAIALRGRDRMDGVDRMEVRGLRTEDGPIPLADGALEIRREAGRLLLEGWGSDGAGGLVDLRANFSERPPYVGRMRLYPDALRVSLPPVVDAIELSGALIVDRRGQESERTTIALKGILPGASGGSPSLVVEVDGDLERAAGRWNAQRWLRIRGEARDLRGRPDLRALHGRFRGSLILDGATETPEARLRLDLDEMRVRASGEFDKPAGVPASLDLVARSRDRASVHAEGRVSMAGLRGRIEAEWDEGLRWDLQTAWCPVREVEERVPWLERGLLDRGRIRFRVRGEPHEQTTAIVEVEDLTFTDEIVRVPRAMLSVADGGIRLEPTVCEVVGQPVTLSGKLRPNSGSPGWEVMDFDAEAPHLDADPILAVLPQEEGPEGPPEGFEQTAEAAVRWLHTRSYLLRDLAIRDLRVALGTLSGEGFEERPIRIGGSIVDGVVRLSLDDEDKAPGGQFCLDLKRWRPRLNLSRPNTVECLQRPPRPFGG